MVVRPELARACMANFDSIMQGSDLQKIKASYSSSVSFATPEFAAWLTTNGYLADTVSLRVSFGIYTEEAAREINKPEYEGRLTVFIWPILITSQNAQTTSNARVEAGTETGIGDDEAYPYNTGTIEP